MKSLPEVRERKVVFDKEKRRNAWKIELELIRNIIY